LSQTSLPVFCGFRKLSGCEAETLPFSSRFVAGGRSRSGIEAMALKSAQFLAIHFDGRSHQPARISSRYRTRSAWRRTRISSRKELIADGHYSALR
jgi:hypothetical protein